MLKIKMAIRKILIFILRFVPIGFIDRIKKMYINAKSGTLKKRLLHKILTILSYKDISKSINFFEVGGKIPFKLATCHSVLINQLYFFGDDGYEPLESIYWEHLCKQSKGILELGANVGYHTIQGALANPDAKYVAVEPHPVNLSLLKKNFELNNITSVEIVEAAVVGEKTSDTMDLAIPINDFQDSPSGCYLSQGAEAIKRVVSQLITVNVIEARDLTNGIDLIKIDVEGYEYNILSSIHEYITRDKPVIFVEVLNKAEHLKQFIFELCQKHDYKIYCFSDTALVTLNPESILEINVWQEFKSRDVILSASPLETITAE